VTGEKDLPGVAKIPQLGSPLIGAYARANTLLTEFAYDWPPRVVLMPRALRASAIW